jgi:hypothetical protein
VGCFFENQVIGLLPSKNTKSMVDLPLSGSPT